MLDRQTQRPNDPSGTTVVGRVGAVINRIAATGATVQSAPRGLTVDRSGNTYVAESSNPAIRHITPTGLVTPLAGSAGNQTKTDSPGVAFIAHHEEPWGGRLNT